MCIRDSIRGRATNGPHPDGELSPEACALLSRPAGLKRGSSINVVVATPQTGGTAGKNTAVVVGGQLWSALLQRAGLDPELPMTVLDGTAERARPILDKLHPTSACEMRAAVLAKEPVPVRTPEGLVLFTPSGTGYPLWVASMEAFPVLYLYNAEYQLGALRGLTNGQRIWVHNGVDCTKRSQKGSSSYRIAVGSPEWKGLVAYYKEDEAKLFSPDPRSVDCQAPVSPASASCTGLGEPREVTECRAYLPGVVARAKATAGSSPSLSLSKMRCRADTPLATTTCKRYFDQCKVTDPDPEVDYTTPCAARLSPLSAASMARVGRCLASCKHTPDDCVRELTASGTVK